jgi:hypothetical protein
MGYEFVSSPASGQALEPTPDSDKIRTVSGTQYSFRFSGYWVYCRGVKQLQREADQFEE